MQQRKLLLLAVLLVAVGHACNNRPKAGSDAAGAEAAATTATPRPDNNDLQQLLEGRWQSTDDSTYVVEIRGNKMRHLNGGQLSMETEIEVDGTCQHTACGGQAGDGSWCFVEKSTDGTSQCNVVDQANDDVLQYHALGAAGGGNLSFIKVRGEK